MKLADKITDMSCPSSMFCMAIAGMNIYEYDGTDWYKWTSTVALPNISCASKTFCVIGSNPSLVFDGTDWTEVATAFPGSANGSLSCTSPTFCMTVSGGRAWSFNGTAWSAAGTVDSASATNGPVSCGSSKMCAAIDGTKGVAMFNGSKWAIAPGTAGVRAVSCPTSTYCAATGTGGMLANYQNGHWSPPIHIPPTLVFDAWGAFDKTASTVSCSGPDFCVAQAPSGETAVMTRGPLGYHARTPTRLFDTRTGAGGVPRAKLGAKAVVRVKVAGTHGIPADATSVALNVTAVGASRPTFITVYPYGSGRPQASTLNPSNAAAVANFTIVKIGSGGYIDVFNDAGSVDILADIAGFFTADAGYHGITPTRLFDTRTGAGGVPRAKIGAKGVVRVKVAGTHGIPADAKAVALNLTAVGASQPTFVTVYPYGRTRPHASTLNPPNASAVANFTIVKIGSGGYIDVFNDAGSVNVLADIAGYYGAAAELNPVTPLRLLDTRWGQGQTIPRGPIRITKHVEVGLAGVWNIPPNATAVAVNVTVVGATRPTFVTLYPVGDPLPHASTVNAAGPGATANFAIVKLGPGGFINVYNDAGSVNVIIDVVGYYSVGGSPGNGVSCTAPCLPT